MKHLTNFYKFINESASIIHLKDMIDLVLKAEKDLMMIDDKHAREIKSVLNRISQDLYSIEVSGEAPDKEFMKNLVSSLLRLKEQGKAIPFSKYPDFSQMDGKFSAPLGSLQKAIEKGKKILDFTV